MVIVTSRAAHVQAIAVTQELPATETAVLQRALLDSPDTPMEHADFNSQSLNLYSLKNRIVIWQKEVREKVLKINLTL